MLEIFKEMDAIREMYANDKSQETFNLLLLGEMGSGKTDLLQTCRRPIHIDSFDPGGTKLRRFRDAITAGWLICDTRWEKEDPMKPTVAEMWIKEMDKREKMGYFDHLGTYALDSKTSWMAAMMNRQLKSAGLAGTPPRFTHDYMPVKTMMNKFIKRMMSFPCDFILTAHFKMEKDETTGKLVCNLLSIGDMATTVPTLFDEVYVAQSKEAPGGKTAYTILTAPKGLFRARTRMGGGVFAPEEEPDIRKLLTKAGREVKDLPWKGGDAS